MFTVTWNPHAINQTATIWLQSNAEARARLTDFVAEVDRNLRANADRIGESRERGVRISVNPPLGFEFRVSVLDRVVTVFRVWSIEE